MPTPAPPLLTSLCFRLEGAALLVTAVAAPDDDAALTRHVALFLALLALETKQGGLHTPPLACTFLCGG
jgi:hypothetical protein